MARRHQPRYQIRSYVSRTANNYYPHTTSYLRIVDIAYPAN
jgi:hypothetical protein